MKLEKEMWAVVDNQENILEWTLAESKNRSVAFYTNFKNRKMPMFAEASVLGYTCQKVKVTIELIEH